MRIHVYDKDHFRSKHKNQKLMKTAPYRDEFLEGSFKRSCLADIDEQDPSQNWTRAAQEPSRKEKFNERSEIYRFRGDG